eukprot:1177268-Prorocentrum_minimum.AAC.1
MNLSYGVALFCNIPSALTGKVGCYQKSQGCASERSSRNIRLVIGFYFFVIGRPGHSRPTNLSPAFSMNALTKESLAVRQAEKSRWMERSSRRRTRMFSDICTTKLRNWARTNDAAHTPSERA